MYRFHAEKQYKQKRRWPWIILLMLLPLFLLAGVAAYGYYAYNENLKPVSDSTELVVVTVPVGTSAAEVGEQLYEQDLIRSAWVFDIYTRVNNYRSGLQAGGYKFSQSMSVEEIVQMLLNGEVATDLVTILPGQRFDQIKASLIQSGFSRDEVNEAFNPKLYFDHPIATYKPETDVTLEGYLYPESFQRSATTTLEEVLRASLDEMYAALSPQLRSDLAEQGLTVHQAVILASIVEREVSNPDDRTKVAQVFLKRLNEGISLGSDPTALYGALLAGIEPTVFADTPYNTRLYAGLPPGPINNVSIESLEAVAYPADTDFLFFVSGDDGNTYFSNTLAEHEALTAQHCIELCASY